MLSMIMVMFIIAVMTATTYDCHGQSSSFTTIEFLRLSTRALLPKRVSTEQSCS